MRRKTLRKRIAAGLLGLAIAFTLVPGGEPFQVRAANVEATYANKCQNSVTSFSKANTGLKTIAWAYLAGTDDWVKPSWYQGYETLDMYTVEPGTKIQGKTVAEKWLPQDNREYLKTIAEKYLTNSPEVSNKINRVPDNWAGTHREGAKFRVVACDEDWVTIWDDGFQLWGVEQGNGNAVSIHCQYGTDSYMETHPAGFYRFRKKDVWLDFALAENHPYKSADEIPQAGSGVVTKLVNLRPVPDESEKIYTEVYALPKGTKLNVVSAEPVPSRADGSTHAYYKVTFNGSDKVQNNAVYYLSYKVPGMYYIDSRYLNFTKKGAKRPSGAVAGEIMNVESSASVYAYASKSTGAEKVGILSKGATLDMLPAESDEQWTTVIFSGKKAYVQTKYLGGKVEDISTPYLADIVDDQLVFKWNAGSNNVDYAVTLTTLQLQKGKQTTVYSTRHHKSNTFTVDRKYTKSGNYLRITVQANGMGGKKGKAYYKQISLPKTSEVSLKERFLIPDKTSITIRNALRSVQYSTNKNFKNAKIAQNAVDKDGNMPYVKLIKGLKKNTTYYIRCRGMYKYETAAGVKWMSGPWSKTVVKVKTKK